MKITHVMMAMMLLVMSVGCGKTLAELRTNGDAIVDNGATFVNQAVNVGAGIVKKAIGAGVAVYDIGKKVVEDVKDNTGTVVNVVTGTSENPVAPATK
jgi:hypothetical protein